jgi:hypothetical protein
MYLRSLLVAVGLCGVAGHAAADSPVTFGTPTVTGGLDAKAVRNTVTPSQPSLAACYQRARVKEPGLGGRAVAKFTVGADGKVADATAPGAGKALEVCVVGVLGALVFARPTDGKPATVSYPVTFTQPKASGAGTGTATIGTGSIGKGAGSAGYGRLPSRTVLPGEPTSTGSLEKPIIRRYMKRASDKIQACYEEALVKNEKLEGTATAQFTIMPTGHVTGATTTGMSDAALERCISLVIGGLQFPKPPDGKPVTVRYPYSLRAINN